VNLTEWAHAQGVHVQTGYRWYREGTLPVPARKAGGAGRYARVSWPDQRSGLDGQVARLSVWAADSGLPAVRAEAGSGSGVNGSRAEVRRLLADPAVTVVVAGHRDRLGRTGTELAAAALSAHNRRLVVPGGSDVTGDLARDMAGVLTWFCARCCGRRPARNRAGKALGCARQDIGPRAVKLQTCGAV
jgi:putative resolvase